MSYRDIVIALEFAPDAALDIPQAWLAREELEARGERLLANARRYDAFAYPHGYGAASYWPVPSVG